MTPYNIFVNITQDTSFVNIVDARNYDKHQVVHLHQQGPDLPTTGLCFPSDGTHIYVGKSFFVEQSLKERYKLTRTFRSRENLHC